MSLSLPPDLRVLYRKLSSIPPTQLPQSLPSLVNHVIRCERPLSASHDPKAKGEAAESAQLVSKLKTSITTLINSRTREARFAAIALIKAVVDVGGWEILRACEPWVRGLLSVVQKSDPAPSKELAIVTLTRIFVLVHPYQTLVREVATPNIPAFATACLQLLKSPSLDQVSNTPLSVIETVCDAFSTLIPLYPATFRPSSSQSLTAIKPFLAPTDSDNFIIPATLTKSARRLAAAQHFVAAKSGGSEEWLKLIDSILAAIHVTADQVLRAIDESWESATGFARSSIELDKAPSGGDSKADQLPPWSGIQAGSQRLIGLFGYLSDCLCYSTKGAVAVPLTKITDAITRVCLIARLSPKSQTWEQALQTKAAVGREEKEELWSVMPDIHIAALRLAQTLFQRLGEDMLPYASEVLDHLTRVFNSGISIPSIRYTSYEALCEVLAAAGQTTPKQMVDMLNPAINACCRDLQQDSGYLKQPKKVSSDATETKKNGLAANADLFLQKPQSSTETQPTPLEPRHKSAASAVLVAFLSQVPQKHLKPGQRGLLDQTAIITRNKEAMLASVLNPYSDSRGQRPPALLPHLMQQFPQDQDVDLLQTNLRTDINRISEADLATIEEEENPLEEEDEEMNDDPNKDAEVEEEAENTLQQENLPAAPLVDLPIQSNPFESKKSETATGYGGFGDVQPRANSPPKRKHEGSNPVPPKRQDLGKSPEPEVAVKPTASAAAAAPATEEVDDDDDDDSDVSVHLNMELEDDDDEDED